MMDEAKLSRILKSMEEHDVPQLIMSDPLAIYYLLGKKVCTGRKNVSSLPECQWKS